MNSRKLAYLIGTTLLWGGIAGLMTGILLVATDPSVSGWNTGDWLVGAIGWTWGGFIYGAISLLGFFAFLLMNQLGLGLFKGPAIWSAFLLVLIAVTFFDMVYFRYQFFAEEGETLLSYFWLPAGLLLWAALASYVKMKQTNKRAFVPTLFFLFTVTVLELFPALRTDNVKSMLDMLIPLVAANTWQILTLHRLLSAKKS